MNQSENNNKKIVAFGEIMLRLSPPDNSMIADANLFSACYGGCESNVLVCLSCLGNETEFLTAIPNNELGNAALKHLRAHNVGTKNIIQQGETLGMYFLEEGFEARPSKVVYNRKHSEVSKLTENAFDFDKVFEGCNIFHISGISFALSESVKKLCFQLLEEAKKRNITISFDFNYRKKLWTEEEAGKVYKEVIKYVDILFCSENDLKDFLDTDITNFYHECNSKYLIVRERKAAVSRRHTAKATVYYKTEDKIKSISSENLEINVLERIGSGDAFVGGVLHSLNKDPNNIKEALNFGTSCFILKHTLKGDVFTLDEKTVIEHFTTKSKDIKR